MLEIFDIFQCDLFLIFSIVAANLAWLSDKLFCIKAVGYKSGWLRWFEWLVWYAASFASGLILEYKPWVF